MTCVKKQYKELQSMLDLEEATKIRIIKDMVASKKEIYSWKMSIGSKPVDDCK